MSEVKAEIPLLLGADLLAVVVAEKHPEDTKVGGDKSVNE